MLLLVLLFTHIARLIWWMLLLVLLFIHIARLIWQMLLLVLLVTHMAPLLWQMLLLVLLFTQITPLIWQISSVSLGIIVHTHCTFNLTDFLHHPGDGHRVWLLRCPALDGGGRRVNQWNSPGSLPGEESASGAGLWVVSLQSQPHYQVGF